jgi:hypothetical protein
MTKERLTMGLIKKASDKKPSNVNTEGGELKGGAAPAKSFEGEPEPQTAAAAEAPAAAAAPAEQPTPSTSTAVAAKPAQTALAPSNLKMMDFVAQSKDRYRVDWNTLDRIQANNGNFLDLGDNKKSMGATIQMRLLSWQDSWQVSPGSDSEEAKQYVRYSDDGKVTKQGENIEQYLEKLRGMYPNASCDHRVVIAGVLEGAEKGSRLEGQLVQIDLSKTSKQEFDKYQINTAYKLGKGLLTQESVELMTMKAEVVSGKNNRSWTKVNFEPTTLEG